MIGKAYGRKWSNAEQPSSPRRLAKIYQEEVYRQQMLIKKAEVNERRLILLVSGLRRLLSDEHFCTLLRAEGLTELPKSLADHLKGNGS